MNRRAVLILGCLVVGGWGGGVRAQEAPVDGEGVAGPPATEALAVVIARQDSALFAAFNAHDLERLMGFFAEGLEFYHDVDGLLSHEEVTAGFRRLFAMDNGLRRDLLPGTSEVFPVAEYGAIQRGEHRFCHEEGGRQDCGSFGFTHVWRKEGGRWRITRALSYGH